MRRYKQYLKYMKDAEGTQRYESIRYPLFEIRNSDQFIITKELERLDIIAQDYYNDSTKWWIISRANNLPPGSFRVKPGTRLRIPFPLPDYTLTDIIVNNQF